MGGCLGQFTKAKGQKLGVQGGKISLTPQFETLVLVYLVFFMLLKTPHVFEKLNFYEWKY